MIKIKKNICIPTKIVKIVDLDANGTIGHVNKTVQSGITFLNEKELESTNVTITYVKDASVHTKTSSAYDNKG